MSYSVDDSFTKLAFVALPVGMPKDLPDPHKVQV